jgi:DNA repair protein RadC
VNHPEQTSIVERVGEGLYQFNRPVTREELLCVAEQATAEYCVEREVFTDPGVAKRFFATRLHGRLNEVFAVVFLDTKHRFIAYEELFNGSISGCEVHPRVVLQRALANNAAAVMFGHNHPSGDPSPSPSDRAITRRLIEALAYIDVRVLDHIIIGDAQLSMAEHCLM